MKIKPQQVDTRTARERQVISEIARDIRIAYRGTEEKLFQNDPAAYQRFSTLYPDQDRAQREEMIYTQVGIMAREIYKQGQIQRKQTTNRRRTPRAELPSPELLERRQPHLDAARRRGEAVQAAKATPQQEIKKRKLPDPNERLKIKLDDKNRYSKAHIYAVTAISELKRLLAREQILAQQENQEKAALAQTKLKAAANSVIKYFHPSFLKKVLDIRHGEERPNLLNRIVEKKYYFETQPESSTADKSISQIAANVNEFFKDYVIPKEQKFRDALIKDFNESFASEMPDWLYKNLNSTLNLQAKNKRHPLKNLLENLSFVLDPRNNEPRLAPLRTTLEDQIAKFRSQNKLKPYELKFLASTVNLITQAA